MAAVAVVALEAVAAVAASAAATAYTFSLHFKCKRLHLLWPSSLMSLVWLCAGSVPVHGRTVGVVVWVRVCVVGMCVPLWAVFTSFFGGWISDIGF